MSNVKTGDLAFWMTSRGPWPICTVCERAALGDSFMTNTGPMILTHTCDSITWFCEFKESVLFGGMFVGGKQISSKRFPIGDSKLKRISDGDLQGILSGADLDLFLPAPMNAEERAAIKEATEKKGTVKP